MSTPAPAPPLHESTALRSFTAWVDGVGAFLVCPADAVTLGGLSGTACVRFAGDLLASHAAVRRSGEGHVVEAVGPAIVARESNAQSDVTGRRSGSGRSVQGRTDLHDGDELLLFREGGGAVRLRFRRPSALTATATLLVESDHRTDPRFDGIVLLADACVLGPNADAHVRCRDWESCVLLYHRGESLFCKSAAPLVLRGERKNEPFEVSGGDHVTGDGISFRLEGL